MLVVKIGGSVTNPDNVLREIAELEEPVVIVHGASRELDELSRRLGSPPRIVESGRGDSTRYTDSVTMDHFLMAYAGKVNKRIVERLRQLGVNAIGLTGMDGGIVRGRRRPDLRITENGRTKVLHDNHVGTIESVDPTLLTMLMESGYTPVLDSADRQWGRHRTQRRRRSDGGGDRCGAGGARAHHPLRYTGATPGCQRLDEHHR